MNINEKKKPRSQAKLTGDRVILKTLQSGYNEFNDPWMEVQ